ncbi:hypothetical protein [Campylobacter sputorum]|uniref:hypothetical protein n=1 Tax=Campylobacter sputorum TaxID=206 RepID=UPI00053BDEAB|nr:hypothetical protein [Campylobacter sputorum]
MKIYVASPYEALLKQGVSMDMVMTEANLAMIKASVIFNKENEFYSPVLDMGEKYRHVKREIVMQMCLNKLKECNLLFIPNLKSVAQSEGIYEEYVFAKQNDIKIFFDSVEIQKLFESRANFK